MRATTFAGERVVVFAKAALVDGSVERATKALRFFAEAMFLQAMVDKPVDDGPDGPSPEERGLGRAERYIADGDRR